MHWVLVAPVALQDGSRGAAAALEAGVGQYRGAPSLRAFHACVGSKHTVGPGRRVGAHPVG